MARKERKLKLKLKQKRVKANELMVGDWVNHIELPYKVGKVSTIDETSRFVVVRDANSNNPFSVGVSSLEPIPLTEEILKANGWTKNGQYQEYIAPNSNSYNHISYGTDNKHLTIIIDGYLMHYKVSLPLHFVNQLQRALRMCGLNELADNFKIE